MRHTLQRGSFSLICALSLSACGPDIAGTAAASASLKATETQQSQATLERINEQLENSRQLMESRREKTDQQ